MELLRFTLRQLRYFVAAAETLSFTGAARRLHVSQPSISTALSDMEEGFDVQLFLRHHAQGLSLTPAGASLLREARALLRQAEELQGYAQEWSQGLGGTIALGCLVTLTPLIMPSLARRFREDHAQVQLNVTESDQEGLFAGLLDGTLEMAISYDMQVPADIEFRPLVSLPPYAVLPAQHPLAGRDWVTLAELNAHPYVLLDLPLSREYFLSLFTETGLTPNVAHRSASAEVVRGVVANGTGFTLLNFPLRNSHALDGRAYIQLRLAGRHRGLTLGIMQARRTRLRRLVRVFSDFCLDEIPQLAAAPHD